MKPNRLPAIAAWMLDRFLPGEIDPALAGDLLEELQSGRASSWYWWQFTAALGIAFLHRMRRRLPIVLFSAAWSIPLPAACFYLFMRYTNSGLYGRIVQLDWPWSAIGTLALGSGSQLFLLWTGTIVYTYLHYLRTKQVSLIRLFGGLLAIMPTLIVTNFGVSFLYYGRFTFQHVSPSVKFTADLFFLLTRLPFFFSLFFSILIAVPRPRSQTSRIA